MLAAMGYQQGQGLGRGQSGRVVPVAVQLKGGRHGLGVEENKKRKQLQVKQQQRERGKCFSMLDAKRYSAVVSK